MMAARIGMTVSLMMGLAAAALGSSTQADEMAVSLPVGVRAVWDAGKAHHETTPTRERLCINGLWRWQPADERPQTDAPPADRWGYMKVPGCWPGITDYMQKDSQTLYAHPAWKAARLDTVGSAWYEREVTIPTGWADRRVALSADHVSSLARVFVDGRRVGEIRFPGGALDLTGICRPGRKHVLSLLVAALPLRAVMTSYNDTASARQVRGSVPRRGLCGDVFLVSTPRAAWLSEVKIDTSVRKHAITFAAALEGLEASGSYRLRATISAPGAADLAFTSPTFRGDTFKDGRAKFTQAWQPERLWDLHTPQNQYTARVALIEGDDHVLDTSFDVRFGFRELWIDGRDFMLNGTRIFLSSVPLDNAQIGAALASYAGAKESLARLKGIGINMVYTHNYDCEPGSHLGFAEILQAADDVGMLVSFSQPHFSHYDWKAADADRSNGYARHAAYYVRQAGNHPSVVFYAMSHNATGYSEDMNPDLTDGLEDARDTWALNNARLARRAEAIVSRLDPGRIVYHHASGNLGSMHTSNFYPNFVPIQELSDWYEHWATTGVKPVFMCEYGAPFTWDWAMYRGWYKGERTFGSARVPWEFCLAEWDAQFLGDQAYRLSDKEKANLRWEARAFRDGRLWNRWDYPNELGSPWFTDRQTIIGMYLTDNWRAFRTWGVSAISPWEHGHFWTTDKTVTRGREDLPVDWDHLQKPGFSPDYIDAQYERVDLAFKRTDWAAAPSGEAVARNNRPLLAYIAGKPARFTSKDHVFRPGETVEKQLIIINNSRETVSGDCSWSLGLQSPVAGSARVSVPTGQQERLPLRFPLPATLAAGPYTLKATVKFSSGETQDDALSIQVLPGAGTSAHTSAKIALFDPRGETARLLDRLGVAYSKVDATADLAAADVLVVGKLALTPDSRAPRVERVRAGLKVVVFEQSAPVLEKRFGFRVEEYGLRQVFPRLPGHSVLAGLTADHLHDWRGEATTLAPRLSYVMRPRYGPTVEWCGIPVTRVWRCGNRGSVASVLIEKPARGDFLPLVDGGFSLQYSPLLEYREGRGLVVFCQLDVTGRTEPEPAADRLVSNLLAHVVAWNPEPARTVVYAGDPAGLRHLEAAGIAAGSFDSATLSADHVLVAGPGGGRTLSAHAGAVAAWLKAGGNLLAVGLDAEEARSFLPLPVRTKNAEHISAYFEPPAPDSLLAGVGPADVHNRDPRAMPLLEAGAAVVGDGVLARATGSNVVFCQVVPWQFDPARSMNLKRTHRRASFLLSRLLANMSVHAATPLLARFQTPVAAGTAERRYLDGLYLDQPEEWDDPYRFFRW